MTKNKNRLYIMHHTFDLLQNTAFFASIYIYVWILKDLSWQAIMSHQCEKFYLAIQDAQDTCALILKSNCSGTTAV